MTSSGNNISTHSIRGENWSGSIPITLSLAQTSLSSAVAPQPLHRMLSRMSYLHVDLRHDIQRFYNFAPAMTALNMKPPSSETFDVRATATATSDTAAVNNGSTNTSTDSSTKNTDTAKKENSKYDGNNSTSPSSHHGNNSSGINSDNEDIPVCWFQDEVTGIALRWHLFAGVLFDLIKHRHSSGQQQQRFHGNSDTTNGVFPYALPWKIRIHFTSYPSHILPLEQLVIRSPPSPNPEQNNTTAANSNHAWASSDPQQHSVPTLKIVQRIFSNSLKQALFLQHGSSKVAMNMSKQSHVRLWDAVMRNNCHEFWEVSRDLIPTSLSDGLVHVPVRMLVDGKPAVQRPCNVRNRRGDASRTTSDDDAAIHTTHVDNNNNNNHVPTLGGLLSEWLPSSATFYSDNDERRLKNDSSSGSNIHWDVQGIQPPLCTPLVNLWQALCYPDQFLYITVTTVL